MAIDWSVVPYPEKKKKEAVQAQPPSSPTKPAAGSVGIDWSAAPYPGQKKEAPVRATSAPPTAPPTADQSEKGILTRSVFGKVTALENPALLNKATEAITAVMPDAFLKQVGPDYIPRFVKRIGRMGNEAVEFASSPAGLALVGLHLFPATAPFAAIARGTAAAADIGMGAYAAAQMVPDVGALISDPTNPEAAADVIGDAIAAKGLSKVGKRMFRSKFPSEPYTGPSNAEAIATARMIPDAKGKVASLEGIVPKTEREAARHKVFNIPVVGEVARILYPKWPKLMEVSRDIVFDREELLKRMQHEKKMLVYHLRKEVPAADRTIKQLGYAIEGDTPEKPLGPEAKKWLPQLREWRKRHDEILREVYGPDIPLKDSETYLGHIWDLRNDTPDAIQHAHRALVRDPYLKKRKVSSYKEGIEQGVQMPDGTVRKFTSLYDDVADVLDVRGDYAAKAAANFRMANTLKEMGVLLGEGEYQKAGFKNWPKAPEADSIYKAAYGGRMKTGESIYKFEPARVHPDFAPAVDAIFASSDPGKLWRAYELTRTVSKKMSLAMSLFHNNAISEQAQAIDILRPLSSKTTGGRVLEAAKRPADFMRKYFLFNPEYYKGVHAGLFDVVARPKAGDSKAMSAFRKGAGRVLGTPADPPLLRLKNQGVASEWIKAGLNIDAPSESRIFESVVRQRANDPALVKAGKSVAKQAENVAKVFDTSLWDFFHQGSMLEGAESLYASELRHLSKVKPNYTPADAFELRKNIATHINDALGSENWRKLLLSPKTVMAMNTLLLAPQWTLSNLRVITNAFENETGARLAKRWAAGAGLSWFLTTQMLNYIMTGWKHKGPDGKEHMMPDKNGVERPHFTWDNGGLPLHWAGKPVADLRENALNVADGFGPDGRERYLVLGKGFRDIFSVLSAPDTYLQNKTSIPIRMGVAQYSGHAPGGYQQIDMDKGFVDRMEQRASLALGTFVPFTVQAPVRKALTALDPKVFPPQDMPEPVLGFPAVAGMPVSRAKERYIEYMEAGDYDRATAVLREAARQNIRPTDLKRAWSTYKSKKRKLSDPNRKRYSYTGQVLPSTPPPPE